VGMIVPDEKEFVLSFFGAMSAGIVPAPVYPPLLTGRLDSYLERTVDIMRSCEARSLLCPASLLSIVEQVASRVPSVEQCLVLEGMMESFDRQCEGLARAASEVKPSDICFLQYTSGSTRDPRGVVITHRNAIANILSMIEGFKLESETEKAVCWLPLYHDMGLVAYVLLPALLHSQVIFMSPFSFVTRPQTWLEVVSAQRATNTASPNFGLGLAAKYADRLDKIDLSCLKMIVCGAEPIQPDTVRRFLRTFEPFGLRATCIVPAYGMAEATLCMTHCAKGKPFRTLSINRDKYFASGMVEVEARARESRTMEIVSCGRVISGHEIKVIADNGETLPEGRVGEIVFAGASASLRYFGDEESSNDVFRDGRVRTGDLGFLWDGELYVSGRIKDLVIVAGQNYPCQLIEWCVERVRGIRTGNVVAFSLLGGDTERLVIVAECSDEQNVHDINERVRAAVLADFGIRPHDVVVMTKGTLPKTSSGKLRRRKAKEEYERNLRMTEE
ncbi:MAG: fatty acyl-AMP ligase, partial [Deltaproteobacteria bacterium]|nr:fatty acyl-AMP ligase [Deltaproteobacteria bacterium]